MRSQHFYQVSKEVFESAETIDDIKNNFICSTSRVILADSKKTVSFCDQREDMIGFIKKVGKDFFLKFGQEKRIYPKVLNKSDMKIIDGHFVTFHSI